MWLFPRDLFPFFAAIGADQQGAIAATSPDVALGIPSHIQVAIAIGDGDHWLAPLLVVAAFRVEAQLRSTGHHPHLSIWLVAHALQPLAAHPLMHLPIGLAWIPGGEEVAKAAHADVATVIPPAQIANGTSGIDNFSLPSLACVTALVDRTNVGGQFGFLGPRAVIR